MALVHCFGQCVGNPRSNPDHRRLFDAELYRNGVGGLETDAADVTRKPVRVLGHDLDGVGAIRLKDPHRSRGADTVAVQKDYDFSHSLLFSPGCENALLAPSQSDAKRLPQCGCGFRLKRAPQAVPVSMILAVDSCDYQDPAVRPIKRPSLRHAVRRALRRLSAGAAAALRSVFGLTQHA